MDQPDPTEHVFGGRYRIVGEVGRGGMGVIYRGIDSVLDREVAIKVMSADFAESTDEEARGRFFREAKAAAKLQHRNIVTVFEFAEQDGIPYIVMEFLRGRSLSARLNSQPAMTLEQKLDVMTELCNGLQFAHENGVVHRDVKPANVWILEDGAVKLVDFGIAKLASSMTIRGDVMGSASYMSPEQIEGESVTGRSDVFSAAIVLYEMIARRRPFEGDSPTATMMQIVQAEPPPIESIVPGLPKDLIDALGKGLEKNPDDRFRTAADFGTELQLIRMSLPREQTLQIPDRPEDMTLGTLPLRGEPLPNQAAKDETRASLAKKPSVWIAAAAVVVVVVGLAMWLSPTPPPVTGPGSSTKAGQGSSGNGGGTGDTNPVRTLRVESKPEGADITLDGVKQGRTPADVKLAAGGIVHLESRGYRPVDVTVSEEDLKRGSLTRELEAAAGPAPVIVQVQITGDYDFEVWDDKGRLKEASSSHTVSIQEGRLLTLKSSQYFLNERFLVDAHGRRSMPKAAPKLGTITLTGNEQCMVIVDGRRTDYLMQQLPQMAEGPHDFRFECGDSSSIKPRKIDIAAGENPSRPVR